MILDTFLPSNLDNSFDFVFNTLLSKSSSLCNLWKKCKLKIVSSHMHGNVQSELVQKQWEISIQIPDKNDVRVKMYVLYDILCDVVSLIIM